MNTIAPTADAKPFLTRSATPGLRWPSPPYASYGSESSDFPNGLSCLVEGNNGQTRPCHLTGLDLPGKLAQIQVPPSKAVMPLRFNMFRRITLTDPLKPDGAPAGPDGGEMDFQCSELLEYRTRLPYLLQMNDGSRVEGSTIGFIESDEGLFLFLPLNEQDDVQRVFIPKDVYRQVHVGETIGHLLVEQQAVTPEQVELAAREQENLRNRKLGDYLVIKEIVKPEHLLMALEEQSHMPMVRIGEALTALGLVSQEQLADALEKQKTERSVPLGELLVQSGQLTKQDLRIALARKMGYPVVDLDKFPLDAEALRRVPLNLARRQQIVPLLWRNGTLVVAAEDPSRRGLTDELEFSLQCKVVAALASASLNNRLIGQCYAKFGMDDGGGSMAGSPSGFRPAGRRPGHVVRQIAGIPGDGGVGRHRQGPAADRTVRQLPGQADQHHHPRSARAGSVRHPHRNPPLQAQGAHPSAQGRPHVALHGAATHLPRGLGGAHQGDVRSRYFGAAQAPGRQDRLSPSFHPGTSWNCGWRPSPP
jgi:hypothetical protein